MKTDEIFLEEIENAIEDGKLALSSYEEDFVDSMRGKIDSGRVLTKREVLDQIHTKIRVQDIKTLAGRGYAIWTASQAQRPKSDIDTDDSVLSFRNVADCYAKVQKIDFMGSINQTKEERDNNW